MSMHVQEEQSCGVVISNMGKLRDAARRLIQSKAIHGKKRDLLGWKLNTIYIVMVMGAIGLFQLVILEHRWYSSSSSHKEFSSFPHLFASEEETTLKDPLAKSAGNSTTSQHGVHQKNSSLSGASPNQKKIVIIKNDKLLEFRPENTFLPMKDVEQPGMSDNDTNWFMSRLRGRSITPGSGETFDLPMDDPEGRVLCVRGNDDHDGTKNGYGLFQKKAMPRNSIFRRGTTFIADNYWDYNNIWHSMSALANFGTWRLENQCSYPDRLVLYHMGELVTSMGSWITHVLQAAFMKNIPIETGLSGVNSMICFERAVIQRRGLGKVDTTHINALFDMLRCKSRRYCGIKRPARKSSSMEVLVLTRSGPRAFTNESGVAAVVHKECSKVPGCVTRMLNAANLTFCEQVEVMSRTDVLISVHGAQLTNMMFMSPGSRVMEMFPKGWEEFAGVGQEIYKWQADWTRMVHAGRWRDPEGPDCPYPKSETLKCLLFFKDREVGLNATHLSEWTRSVLTSFGATEHHTEAEWDGVHDGLCACDGDDGVVWSFK
ncbi:hypothetical protein KC19_4G210700 [Ceratodon purpureus]|uniref:Glycosyltransferase 61 catalytic domain-containing protein n=1 Tax=Ceratodon purpureus TaxID=3225 RepID=A0A8T0IDD6_CERPU|nr:hypothetical protein KC19_4G210700 [Ceratodon purpureus]